MCLSQTHKQKVYKLDCCITAGGYIAAITVQVLWAFLCWVVTVILSTRQNTTCKQLRTSSKRTFNQVLCRKFVTKRITFLVQEKYWSCLKKLMHNMKTWFSISLIRA